MILKLIFLLFLLIILEFIISNVLNLHSLALSLNFFLTLDDTSVDYINNNLNVGQGRLHEPSNLVVTFPYFSFYSENNNISVKSLLFLTIGGLAILISNSTTMIIIFGLVMIRFILNSIRRKNYLFALTLISFVCIFALLEQGYLLSSLEKVQNFLEFDNAEWGSGFFRGSLKYAMISFMQAPIFGVGVGTVYCHGMVLQVLSNIGIFGIFGVILLYYSIFKGQKLSKFRVLFILFIYFASGLFQEFTSPYFLIVIFFCFQDCFNSIDLTSKKLKFRKIKKHLKEVKN